MDPWPSNAPIPGRLPVLGLPYPMVLHPGLVLSIPMPQAQCLGLLRTALQERKAHDSDEHKAAAHSDESHGELSKAQSQRPVMILCLPRLSPSETVPLVNDTLEGLFEWGCVARVLRLVNSPVSEECRLMVSGIARVQVVRQVLSTDTVPAGSVADVKVHSKDLVAKPGQHETPAAADMRRIARTITETLGRIRVADGTLVNSMVSRVPLLPPVLLKRVQVLLRTKDQINAGVLSDLLVGWLGGACVWEDRLTHLTLVDPPKRLEFTVEMFERGLERVRVMRELLMNVPYALHDQQRTALARAQLEVIIAQLASINPSISASLRVIGDTNEKSDERTVIRRPQVKNDERPPAVVRRAVGNDPRRPPEDADSDDEDDGEDEVAQLSKRIADARLSPEARKVCKQELRRLKRMPTQSMERGILINYLETMVDLPWERTTAEMDPAELKSLIPTSLAGDLQDEPLIPRARKVLEADHYGLDKIKKRILEYLAVLDLKQVQARESAADSAAEQAKDQGEEPLQIGPISVQYKGPILLLVGPPGTGKTSIARSLAAALQRPFKRLSLGGVRDEAEIRGHRRTYVGALPGSIVTALRRAKVSDCVMLLDEVDKLSSGNGVHGDPTAALLEVLDPEQNHTFKDHYINVPIDLSRVLFIATANTLDTISDPLLDRTDVVSVPGYTHDEKVAIARRHILPKQIKAQGLQPNQVEIGDDVLLKIATSYTREAGVRSMERRIGDVVRAKAVEYAEHRSLGGVSSSKPYDPVVRLSDLEHILGIETYEPEVADAEGVPGVATGLAYQGSGNGGILHIESAFMPPGTSQLRLTGSLGDVIRESAELAFSWVKAHAFALGITETRASEFPKNDVHLHIPSGATPKDGPSAGIAMTCALVSLYLRVPLDPHLAMTGEITLRGHVTPVGGIKEKVLGAHRAGIRKVILPARNRKDFEQDLPKAVREDLDVRFVTTIQEALVAVFGMSLEAQINTLYGDREGARRLQELEWHSRL